MQPCHRITPKSMSREREPLPTPVHGTGTSFVGRPIASTQEGFGETEMSMCLFTITVNTAGGPMEKKIGMDPYMFGQK